MASSAGSPSASLPSFDIHTNPYKAQRTWPPDFTKLSPKHQFRFERRYRRRTKLKYARPRWIRAVKLTQWGSMIGVLGYGIFYMDWGDTPTPFQGVRSWFKEQANSIWSSSSVRQQPNQQTPKPEAPRGQ